VDEGVAAVIDRAAFGRRIEAVLDWTQSERRRVGVLFVGLDGADDEVLCQAAERVSSIVRRGDAVTRLAGDELAVILADVSEQREVQAAAARARTVFAEPFSVGGALLSVHADMGHALAGYM
jgi:diguanylate cyclase (GGDEF)-like protein